MQAPITYVPGFIDNPEVVFQTLWNGLEWERRGNTPRREYYSNDVSVPYTYGRGAGIRSYDPKSWHPLMMDIRKKLEAYTGTKFEVCFLNGYETQNDHLGWHADDSPEMDDKRPIAIVSLGSEREIWFKEQPILDGKCIACNGSGRYDSSRSPKCSSCNGTGKEAPTEVHKLKLGHGSLCLMAPGMQDSHFHRIPKAGFQCGERVSLTFRGYVV